MKRLTGMVILAALASCATATDGELGGRLSVGGGRAIMNGKDGSDEGLGTGEVYGVRAEVFREADVFEDTTAGFRVQGVTRDVTADGFGDGTGRLDMEVTGVELQAVFRHTFPTGAVRPYGEVYGGAAYSDGKLTASGSGLPTPISAREDEWSLVGGAGLGVEFDISRDFTMFVQGDWSIRYNDVDPLKLRTQDVMLWVGGEVSF